MAQTTIDQISPPSPGPVPASKDSLWIMVADKEDVRFFVRENQLFSCFHTILASAFADEGAAPSETRQAHQRLVKDASAWIDIERGRGAFDRLIVVAPTDIMEEMRQALSKQVEDSIIASEIKSVSEKSEIELAAELASLVSTHEKKAA